MQNALLTIDSFVVIEQMMPLPRRSTTPKHQLYEACKGTKSELSGLPRTAAICPKSVNNFE